MIHEGEKNCFHRAIHIQNVSLKPAYLFISYPCQHFTFCPVTPCETGDRSNGNFFLIAFKWFVQFCSVKSQISWHRYPLPLCSIQSGRAECCFACVSSYLWVYRNKLHKHIKCKHRMSIPSPRFRPKHQMQLRRLFRWNRTRKLQNRKYTKKQALKSSVHAVLQAFILAKNASFNRNARTGFRATVRASVSGLFQTWLNL